MKSVIICDMEGVIETINPDGEKLFGYSKEELVGKKRVSLFSAGEIVIQNVGMWLSKANKNGQYSTKTYFINKNGKFSKNPPKNGNQISSYLCRKREKFRKIPKKIGAKDPR